MSQPTPSPIQAPGSAFWAGVRAQLPILLGTSPFGMIYGVLAVGAQLPFAAAQGMSALVFAGSAQFIATGLFGGGTPGPLIVLITFVVNLRHALYSASLAPHLRGLSARWRAVLAFLLTDEAYAVVITHAASAPPQDAGQTRRLGWYTLGAGLTLFVSWQISTALGALLGAAVPASWELDFTLALTFIALVIPALTDRPALASALVAGVTAVLARGLEFRLGLLVAAAAGIAAGLLAERVWPLAPVAEEGR